MEGVPVPECAVSAIQVRNNLHAAKEVGESDFNPQEDSRREQINAAKQPQLMSDVADGEIDWETESETELEEDPRDALWDSDGVDGWSDVRLGVAFGLWCTADYKSKASQIAANSTI